MLVVCPPCRRQYDVTGIKAGEPVRCRCGQLIKVPKTRPHEARILHCSGCGAKLREKARACDYCRGEITKAERQIGAPCPQCFGRLPLDAHFCPECGVRIDPEKIRAVRAKASCPRCSWDLTRLEYARGELTQCTGCGGLWISPEVFERLTQAPRKSDLAALFPGSRGRKGRPEPEGTVRYLPCPVCATVMHRKMFGGNSGVVIDWCKGHGFWFDDEELEKVLDYVRTNGMPPLAHVPAADPPAARQRPRRPAAVTPVEYSPEWDQDPVGLLVKGLLNMIRK